jgi:hypothetical protein
MLIKISGLMTYLKKLDRSSDALNVPQKQPVNCVTTLVGNGPKSETRHNRRLPTKDRRRPIMKIATEPKERPILFSGPMVRALLAGEKTQTRRVVKIKESNGMEFWTDHQNPGVLYYGHLGRTHGDIYCPYGKPGDRLWVREAFTSYREDSAEETVAKAWFAKSVRSLEDMLEFSKLPGGSGNERFLYAADFGGCEVDWSWRPSIHMPRRASRLSLEILSVKAERLHSIHISDVAAEGYPGHVDRSSFVALWNQLNAASGYSWDSNPWVWAVTFKLVTP